MGPHANGHGVKGWPVAASYSSTSARGTVRRETPTLVHVNPSGGSSPGAVTATHRAATVAPAVGGGVVEGDDATSTVGLEAPQLGPRRRPRLAEHAVDDLDAGQLGQHQEVDEPTRSGLRVGVVERRPRRVGVGVRRLLERHDRTADDVEPLEHDARGLRRGEQREPAPPHGGGHGTSRTLPVARRSSISASACAASSRPNVAPIGGVSAPEARCGAIAAHSCATCPGRASA